MGVAMEICPFDQETHTGRGGLREAFADLAQRRCGGDVGVQGRVQREWSLSADEAKGLLRGQTSIRTMEKVLQHKNGGWRVGLAILGSVIGNRLTDYFASEKVRLNHEAEQRRRRAALLEDAESFLNAADVGHHAPRRGSDLDPGARDGLAAFAS